MHSDQLTDEYVLYHPAFSAGNKPTSVGELVSGGMARPCTATTVKPGSYAYSRGSQEFLSWFRNCYKGYDFRHQMRWTNPQGFVFPLLDVIPTAIPIPTKNGDMKMFYSYNLSPAQNENPYWEEFAPWEFTGTAADIYRHGQDYAVSKDKIKHRKINWAPQVDNWIIPDIFAKLLLNGGRTGNVETAAPVVNIPEVKIEVPPTPQKISTIIGCKIVVNLTGKTINIRGKRAPSNGIVSVYVNDGQVSVLGLPEPTPGIVYYVQPEILPLCSGRDDVKAAKK